MKVEQPLHNQLYMGQSDGIYRPPAARRPEQQQHQQAISSKSREAKQRRPDREVYVPRGRRLLAETPPQAVSAPDVPQSIENTVAVETKINEDTKTVIESTKDKTNSKKSHDRNYCNIYRPPHARVSEDSLRTQHPAEALKTRTNDVRREVRNSEVLSAISDSDHQDGADSCFDSSANIGHLNHVAHDIEERLKSNNIMMQLESVTNAESLDSHQNETIIDNRSWNIGKDEDGEQKEFKRATEEINRSNRRLIKQSFDSDELIITDPIEHTKRDQPKVRLENPIRTNERDGLSNESYGKFNPEEDEWESMFDESGECLEPSLLAELTQAVGKVSVQRSKVPIVPGTDSFAHVLEIYNFPASFTTVDLYSAFADFKDKGFEIKWVDDTHALAVFSSPKIAAEVLALSHSLIKTRPLQDGTSESRQKARKSAEFLQPYRQRPETCPLLARRIITGQLGMKLPTAREERIEERRVLTEAREKKKLAAKNKEAAWEGIIPNQIQ